MEGSRLFLMAEDQDLGFAWRRMLQFRMRARKLLEIAPGFGVVLHPYADPSWPMPHADRLYVRDALSRGSAMQKVGRVPKTMDAFRSAADEILDEWLSRQRRSRLLRDHVGGWGDPYGKILFVCDAATERPFSKQTGDSLRMTHILNAAGLREPHLYFAGAFDAKGLSILSPYEIVALGADAGDRLEQLGVKSYVTFPHPRHVADAGRWGEKLRNLLSHVVQ